MGRDDWYRNKVWTADVEAAFRQRLRRARDKSQYLRIQAGYLVENHPLVALGLIEEYFALGEHFDHAAAYWQRARALKAIGQTEAAFSAYEAALERELQFPHLKTQAYLDYAFAVVQTRTSDRYARALEVLDIHRLEVTFPVDEYRANGIRALVYKEWGRPDEAKAAAALAISAAGLMRSGFRYHPKIGLVASTDDDFGQRVAALAR